MNTGATRCDRIIALIDACLAEVEGASTAQVGHSRRHRASSRSTTCTQDPDTPLTSRKDHSYEPVFD
jgi:hypothetical protein